VWLQIIRHLLPNGIDFTLVVKKTVKDVQNWMNTYHRRILGDMPPCSASRRDSTSIKILKVA